MKNPLNTAPFLPYSVTQGKEYIDWNKALANPPPLNSLQHHVLTSFSGEWPTCACGNLCAALPRNDIHVPKDNKLCEYGIQFCEKIEDGHWEEAKQILQKIEARSTELLIDMGLLKEPLHGSSDNG